MTLQDFVERGGGEAHGVTAAERAVLVEKFNHIRASVRSYTGPETYATLARELLAIPRTLPGVVVECGCCAGASAAALSLVCRAVGRRLIVCDSFQGLPAEGPRLHKAPHYGYYGYIRQGDYSATLEEAKENIARYGAIEVCEFVSGFFADSLHALWEPIAFAFLDVDMVQSTRDCIRYVWPLLVESGQVWTDDAHDLDITKVWFDDAWWRDNLGQDAPGYVGSGCGVEGVGSIGYAMKTTILPDYWTVPDWFRPEPEELP